MKSYRSLKFFHIVRITSIHIIFARYLIEIITLKLQGKNERKLEHNQNSQNHD